MPMYAYECDNCGVRFDRRQGFDDEPVKKCPECRGKVHRLIQPAGVIFKGAGFYSTDNKGSSSTVKTNGASKDAAGSESSAKSDKAESKPEAKAEKPAKPAPAKAASTEN